ncbi:hypothetical protein BSKO_06635 [Bryopsis sp. KO-2023]|nr:hypothetical protein BSKO_06635 [Bryopsis sp. KO-2023]
MSRPLASPSHFRGPTRMFSHTRYMTPAFKPFTVSWRSFVRIERRVARNAVDREVSDNGGGLDPQLEMAVPADQRPINELKKLKESQLSSWVLLDSPEFQKRFALVWGVFFVVISGPISAQTFDPVSHPLGFFAGGASGAFLAVAAVALRLNLTWSYVGNRLLSATVEYEETGWYDGQMFVKPPEVLARDRLLGTYEVRPILARLKTTLIVCAVCLGLSASTFYFIGVNTTFGTEDAPKARVPSKVTTNGVVYSKSRNISDFLDDEDAAREEAEAQGGVPGYCGDRYYRAFAGGSVCKKFD